MAVPGPTPVEIVSTDGGVSHGTMRPTGHLDIHGHFYLPESHPHGMSGTAMRDAMQAADFMVPHPVTWSPESVLAYNDSANVQMQMLSYIPPDLPKLHAANDYANTIVRKHPSRFGFLAALPTDDADACLAEIDRVMRFDPKPDGFATSTVYKGVGLGDPRLEPVWTKLDDLGAVVHVHPNAYAGSNLGRPAPVIEVAFDTCRTAVDMMYRLLFKRYPHIRFVLGHCGGALPALSGRISLLGTEQWVPNPHKITRTDIEGQLKSLYVDTAATAKTGLAPAVKMVGQDHIVYGSDCGVPCSNDVTMNENIRDLVDAAIELNILPGVIFGNGWNLFPAAAIRAGIV